MSSPSVWNDPTPAVHVMKDAYTTWCGKHISSFQAEVVVMATKATCASCTLYMNAERVREDSRRAERRAEVEQLARSALAIYSHRAEREIVAWELLTNAQRQAWCEVVEYLCGDAIDAEVLDA